MNFFEYFLVFVSAVRECASVSTFASLVGILVGIAMAVVGLNFLQSLHELRVWINYQEKKKHNVMLLEKSNLNTIEILISKALINSYISHKK